MTYPAMTRFGFIATLILFLGFTVSAAPKLQGHRAVYDLSLKEVRSGGGIANVKGRIVHQWSRTCAGYVMTQRTLMSVENVQGDKVVTDFGATNWESLDSTRLRFSIQHQVDGKLKDRFDGRAKMQPLGGPGTAKFTHPKPMVLTLPKGTLFPTAHTLAVLQGARAGETIIARPIFDGSDEKAADNAVAILTGKVVTADAKFPSLRGLKAWRGRIAFYKYGQISPEPEYELGFVLYDNGIIGDMVLDYGDFILDGRLSKLDLLKDEDC